MNSFFLRMELEKPKNCIYKYNYVVENQVIKSCKLNLNQPR